MASVLYHCWSYLTPLVAILNANTSNPTANPTSMKLDTVIAVAERFPCELATTTATTLNPITPTISVTMVSIMDAMLYILPMFYLSFSPTFLKMKWCTHKFI